jgi:hypothetical protein
MLSIGIISLYTTYAYEEENNTIIKEPISDSNLVYLLKNSTNKEISVGPKERKFFDINLKNTYESTVRYGMYYYMINPEKLPNNVTISLAEGSEDALESTIKPSETRSVSLQITNDSDYAINLIIGALIGYEYGDMEELEKDGIVLIK